MVRFSGRRSRFGRRRRYVRRPRLRRRYAPQRRYRPRRSTMPRMRGHPLNTIAPVVPANGYYEHITTTGVHDRINSGNGAVSNLISGVTGDPAINSFGTTVIPLLDYDRFATDRTLIDSKWDPYAMYKESGDPNTDPVDQICTARTRARGTIRLSSLTGSNVWVRLEMWVCRKNTLYDPYQLMVYDQAYLNPSAPTAGNNRAAIGGYPSRLRPNSYRVKSFWRRVSVSNHNLGHGVNKSVPYVIPANVASAFDYTNSLSTAAGAGQGTVNTIDNFIRGSVVFAVRVYGQLGALKDGGNAASSPVAAGSSIAFRMTHRYKITSFIPAPTYTSATIAPNGLGERTGDGLTNLNQAWVVNNFGEGVLGQPDVVIPGEALP